MLLIENKFKLNYVNSINLKYLYICIYKNFNNVKNQGVGRG